MVQDGRSTCQNCGTAVSTQAGYIGGSQYDLTQPQNMPQVNKIDRKSRKKIVTAIVVIVIIIIAVIGLAIWNQVQLTIADIDTEGEYLVITIKNEGWGNADGENIEVKINYDEKFQWEEGDIDSGEEKTSRISMPMALILDVQVLYNGWEHDIRS